MAPVLEEISGQMEGKVSFYNVDVDEVPELAMRYGIQSIPCLLILKEGKAVDQSVGFRPGPQVESWIKGNL